MFFYVFELENGSPKQIWVILNGVNGRGLLTLNQSLYKGFNQIFG